MIAQIAESADPWIGLGFIGLVVLGFVAFARGGFGVVLTILGTIAGGALLLARLDQVLDDCDRVLAALDRSLEAEGEAALARRIVVQGFDQTVLDALFHAVEHMSYHTGQIVHIARRHGSAPIRFYDDRALGELP